MTMPNFLIVGAAKSGTTALHHYLSRHPDIYMCPVKEANFFAYEGQQIQFRGPGDLDRGTHANTATNLDSYLKLFSGCKGESAIGEAAPEYLFSEIAASNIRSHIPNVKIICILRNPVDRAFSHYTSFRSSGRETARTFEEALQLEQARIEQNWSLGWRYRSEGMYFEQLKRYFDQFDRDHILILLYEELQDDSSGAVKKIFRFIGIDDNFEPDTSIRYNQSRPATVKTWNDFLVKPNRVKDFVRPLFPRRAMRKLRAWLIDKNLRSGPRLNEATRKRLAQYYSSDLEKVQSLTGLDLSAWIENVDD